jgi:hypothetical protein
MPPSWPSTTTRPASPENTVVKLPDSVVIIGSGTSAGGRARRRRHRPGSAELWPAAFTSHGEGGGVADTDPPLVVGQVVDPIGDGLGAFSQGPVGEIVDLDAFGLTFKLPFLPRLA